MYQNNYAELKKLVAQDGVVINVSKHRNPDGSMNRKLNLDTWNSAVERFEAISLCQKARPRDLMIAILYRSNRRSSLSLLREKVKKPERSSSPAAAVSRPGPVVKDSMLPCILLTEDSIRRY